MKKLLLFILPLAAIAFNSCSKGGDNNGNNPTNYDKLILRVTANGGVRGTITYSYDSQNRLIKETRTQGSNQSEITYSYSDNQVTCMGNKYYKTTYGLDDNGYLESYTYETSSTPEDDTRSNEYSISFKNSYLYKFGNIDSNSGDGDYVYEWKNGNMVKGLEYGDGNNVDKVYCTSTYMYTSHENKASLDINSILTNDFWGPYSVYSIYCTLRFRGTNSKNLIGSMNSDEYDQTTSTYSYELDEDGYPTKVTENRTVRNVWEDSLDSYEIVYEITYLE